MRNFSRTEFLKASAALCAAAFAGKLADIEKQKILLSFSTLGCPDWSFLKIVNFAKENDYSGIELRGILHEMDLTKCNEFNSTQNKKDTLALMKDKGLRFVDLGSSASLHLADATERKKHLDEAKRFIDLAHDIRCPYIRVFPNKFPEDQGKDATIELIAKGLLELGDYAKEKNVMVLMETHGDAVWSEDLEKIIQLATHTNTGLVWDICNMWTITKESPANVYKKLKKWIHHTHIKDAKLSDGKVQYVFSGARRGAHI